MESQETKIVAIPAWRGAIAYWGIAGIPSRWSTIEWLRGRASPSGQYDSPETFAEGLATDLQTDLARLGISGVLGGGIGIHFTAYERVGEYWIPELFLVSNYSDPSYTSLRPNGVGVSRETYGTIAGVDPSQEHGRAEFRHRVREFLQGGNWLHYNNGDPVLFNASAGAFLAAIQESSRRGLLGVMDQAHFRSLARLPVEMVASVQRSFYRDGQRIVGGKVHDLAVTPEGMYSSTSGDAT